MDFEELVHTRKSVRGFKNQPVPRVVIGASLPTLTELLGENARVLSCATLVEGVRVSLCVSAA